MKIGILALQGAFIEHKKMLDKLNVESFEIRKKEDILNEFDGIILPGGESSVIGNLLNELGIMPILKEKIEKGLPVFGTCAGMILLAKEIDNDNRRHISLMDIEVKRNAYGRQLGSFDAKEEFFGLGKVNMRFIRAPYVSKILSNDVQVLSVVNEKIVAVRQNNMLATAFHPELLEDISIHKYFINMIKEIKNGN